MIIVMFFGRVFRHSGGVAMPNDLSQKRTNKLVLLSNSMCKLIHDRCPACKLIIKTATAHVYANEQLPLCFNVSPLKIILKQLFASGEVNDFVSMNIHHYNLSNIFARARLV